MVTRWSDTVKWVLYGLIEAEDLGINSRTLTFAKSQDPVVKRLLGQKETLVKV